MDRGLQERLVGAAVLVALGVWIIPWVLDGTAVSEQSPEHSDALKLPVPEETGGSALRRQLIDLSAVRGATVKTSSPETDPEAQPGAAAEAAGDAATSAAARQPIEESPAPAAVAATVPAERSDDGVETSAPQDAAEAERRTASLPDIIAASPVVGWMVQSGSFGNEGNARRQAQRIETYGHDAGIYKFEAAGGRTMFRVRVGPLETRERAEALASSLAAHGFVAQLVAPE